MTLQRKHTKKIGYAFMTAALFVGGLGCEESKERVLRMEVELGSVAAQPIGLPNGTTVNFPAVAKDLFYRQVMNHSHFNIYIPPVSSGGSVSQKGVATKSAISNPIPQYGKDDLELLSKYGMLNRMVEQSASNKAAGKVSMKSVATVAAAAAAAPSCLYERPLARLGSTVLSFEANFGAGLQLGYNGGGGISVGTPVGGSIDFSSSKMDLTIKWDDNFTKQGVAAAAGISYSADTKFSLGLGSFPVGLDFFYKTPLADVVKSAFDHGLDEAVRQFVAKTAGINKTWKDAWEGRVMSDPLIDNDNFVAFRAGTFAGVMKGDKFTVRNQVYRWVDDTKPCSSPLKYTLPDGDVIAELEVTESSNLITIAKVKALTDGAIRPGAQIKILELIEPTPPKKAN